MKQLSDEQWRQRLSPERYRVLRGKGTEAPFSGDLLENIKKGVYECGACGSPLFFSDTKFDAGCGWPSFYQPIENTVVDMREDTSHGMRRIEVTCKNCGSHLGHVFNDAPDQPTGLRFCINSLSLRFDPDN